jgi:hypothetical protein
VLIVANQYHDIFLATTILNKSCKTVFCEGLSLSNSSYATRIIIKD